MSSGKSKSKENCNGVRRSVNGKELAPRSARRKGKHFLDQCHRLDLSKAKISE